MRADVIERTEAQLYNSVLKLLVQSPLTDFTPIADVLTESIDINVEKLVEIFSLLKRSKPARELLVLLTDIDIASELVEVAASTQNNGYLNSDDDDTEEEPEILELQ